MRKKRAQEQPKRQLGMFEAQTELSLDQLNLNDQERDDISQRVPTRKQQYELQTQHLIPFCVENNLNLKVQVGQCVYEYVEELVGMDQDQAQKITGMITDLSIP